MNKSVPKLIMTADGSHTLYLEELDEHYHSWHGAIQESRYVFIQQGLDCCDQKQVDVLEIGFGTGLNALLTCMDAQQYQRTIYYDTLELYPLPEALLSRLNYAEQLSPVHSGHFKQIHQSPWDLTIAINPWFHLTKICADFTRYEFKRRYGLIYFDAFAPEKQPSMWEAQPLEKLFYVLEPGGILVTYCAKGSIKRLLREIGYQVETLPGPPGKREMIRAARPVEI